METATARDDLVGLLRQAQQALAAVAEEVGSLAVLGGQELIEATELAAHIDRVSDTVMVRVVSAVEEQCRRADPGESVAACLGFRDAAALLMTVTGASRRTLTRWRQVGGATSDRGFGSTGLLPPLFPRLAEALAVGAVSLDQALVIRQHLLEASARAHPDDVDAAECALVDAAVGVPVASERDDVSGDGMAPMPLPPELLAVQARAWRDAIDPDGPEPRYEEQRQRRSFTFGQRSDGMWVGTLVLPPDQGEAIRLALDAHNAPRTPIRHDHGDPGSEVETEALHGAGLRRQGLDDDRTTAQRQADTIVGLVTRAMELTDAPRIGGDAATVVVTISAAELAEHARTGAGTARLERSGELVPAHMAARIICDGYLQVCVLGEDGLPLKLGRARRSHTRHQRRAILTAYPGGCQNPGCHAPPGFTEIHHPVWWSAGATDTDNGVPLCQHCHAEVHAGRLRCLRDDAGRWLVVPTLRLRSRFRVAA